MTNSVKAKSKYLLYYLAKELNSTFVKLSDKN
jgi:hypothetical protein